jgi:hypothetical protein
MFVYLLFAGGMLYGSAAFAGTRAYMFAGIAFAAWPGRACCSARSGCSS